MQTIRSLALALAAFATLASCDSAAPLSSDHAPPDGAVLATAPFPAPAGFAARPTGSSGPSVVLSWEDVPGDEGYLVQWRKGETGAWISLVSTGANRTTFGTDSLSPTQPNYYRIAVFTADFRAGEFSTTLLEPRIVTVPAYPFAEGAEDLRATLYNYVTPVTYWFEWGTDSLLAGAARTPVREVAASERRAVVAERVTVVPGTTYYFRAVATNAGGTAHGEILRFNAGAPDAPAGVAAQFSAAPRQLPSGAYSAAHHVFVQWTHDGNDVQAFRVQRRLAGAAGWVEAVGSFVGARGYVDQGFPVTSNREYDYRVLACNARGWCAPSAEVRVAVQGLPAPAGFSATRAADGRVALAWGDLPSEESFSVQWRAGETGSWQTLLTTSPNVTTHTTDRVTAGVVNHYRVMGEVKSFRGGAFSEDSVAAGAGRVAQVETGASVLPSATSASLGGTVTPNGLPATAWIEWGTDPSLAGAASTPATPVGSGVSAVPFADTVAVASGQTYYYRAAASTSRGTVRGAIRSFHAGPPTAPGLTATFDLAGYRILVTPTHDGGGSPTQFRIERRSTGQTAWTLVQTQPSTTPGMLIESPFPASSARSFDYRAHACNAADECTASVVRTVQTQPLAAPAGFKAVPLPNGQVEVSWQDITGEVDYLLQWRTDPAGPWRHVLSTGPNVTGLATGSVTPGVVNYYRVAGEASGFRTGIFSETSVAVP